MTWIKPTTVLRMYRKMERHPNRIFTSYELYGGSSAKHRHRRRNFKSIITILIKLGLVEKLNTRWKGGKYYHIIRNGYGYRLKRRTNDNIQGNQKR